MHRPYTCMHIQHEIPYVIPSIISQWLTTYVLIEVSFNSSFHVVRIFISCILYEGPKYKIMLQVLLIGQELTFAL